MPLEGKGWVQVSWPQKFSGEDESEFAEWSHKMVEHMEWQFGGNFPRVLEWAGRLKKRIEACAGPDGPGYGNVFRDEWDPDNLENLIGVACIDLMGVTEGKAT